MDPPPRAFSEVLPQPMRTSPQGSEKFGLGAQIATLPAKCTVRQTSQNLFQGSEKLLSELVRGVLRSLPRVLRSLAFLAFLTSGSKSEAIFRPSLPTTKRKREQVKVLKKMVQNPKYYAELLRTCSPFVLHARAPPTCRGVLVKACLYNRACVGVP